MPVPFELLIPRRPVSLQAKSSSRSAWKQFVTSLAQQSSPSLRYGEQWLTLVYLYDVAPVDVDNIIKPIQDALKGVVYVDDSIVSDVDSHRRNLFGTFDLTNLPPLLIRGLTTGTECVYVRVSDAPLDITLIV